MTQGVAESTGVLIDFRERGIKIGCDTNAGELRVVDGADNDAMARPKPSREWLRRKAWKRDRGQRSGVRFTAVEVHHHTWLPGERFQPTLPEPA